MLRRSFLGQLIGAVAGAPFYAKLLVTERPASRLPLNLALHFAGDASLYHAPAIIDVSYTVIKNTGRLIFTAEALKCEKTFTVNGVTLHENMLALGEVVSVMSPIRATPGDTLKFKYQVEMTKFGQGYLPLSVDEAIAVLRGRAT